MRRPCGAQQVREQEEISREPRQVIAPTEVPTCGLQRIPDGAGAAIPLVDTRPDARLSVGVLTSVHDGFSVVPPGALRPAGG